MLEILSRFRPDPDKINGTVFVCLLAIWVLVAGCGVASVWTQDYSRRQRLGWTLCILLLPILGLLMYLPFSFRRDSDSLLMSVFPDRFSERKKGA